MNEINFQNLPKWFLNGIDLNISYDLARNAYTIHCSFLNWFTKDKLLYTKKEFLQSNDEIDILIINNAFQDYGSDVILMVWKQFEQEMSDIINQKTK